MANRRPKMAICYDFDGTLSPGNMQEHDYIPKLGLKSKAFWKEVGQTAQDCDADHILAYMFLMVKKAQATNDVKISRDAFSNYGKTVPLFAGVDTWFKRINAYAKSNNISIEHFIISSGIKEMIEGTIIAKQFKKIYASSFIYDQHNVAVWPGVAVNYTTKTQFLFRINKGVMEVWDNNKINTYVRKSERPIPFSKMIFIGDGSTDVPCMKLIKDQQGHSIAVYQPGSKQKKEAAEKLLTEDRVNFVVSADFTEGKRLETVVRAIIKKIASDTEVDKLKG